MRFKIQNAAGEAARVAAYVDARLVFDRLDLVCGSKWKPRFKELPKPLIPPPCDRDGQPPPRPPIHVRCRLTFSTAPALSPDCLVRSAPPRP